MGKRSWKARTLASLEILLALGLLTDFAAMVLLSHSPGFSDPLDSVRALAAFTTLSSLLLLVLLALLQSLRGESLFRLFLGGGTRRRKEVALGLMWVPAVFAAAYALKSLIHHFAPALYSGRRNVLEELMRSPDDLFLFLFVALFTGGIKEELQRAFVIRRFEAGWGPGWLGALLFACYFGLGHRSQGWDEALIAGGVGLAWGLLFLRRRSAVAPAVSHGLYDAVELIRYYLFGPLRYL